MPKLPDCQLPLDCFLLLWARLCIVYLVLQRFVLHLTLFTPFDLFMISIKDISLGPTAIMSALVAAACARPKTWPNELGTDNLNTTSDPNIVIALW